MTQARRALVGVLCVLAAGGATLGGLRDEAAVASAPGHVAIVIAGVGVGCVPWQHGISGDTVLNDVARVTYRSDGLILQIDGKPADATANATHYWAYWHETSSGWHYSSLGASSYLPKAGAVDGWSFGGGTSSSHVRPPRRSYASICHDTSPKPQPSHGRSSTTSRPSATRHDTTSAPAPSHAASTPNGRRRSGSASRPRARAAGSDTRAAPSPSSLAADASPHPTGADAGPSGRLPTLAVNPSRAESAAGNPTGTVVGVGLAVVVAAGAGALSWRRRRVR
jgi:hypothetical protein